MAAIYYGGVAATSALVAGFAAETASHSDSISMTRGPSAESSRPNIGVEAELPQDLDDSPNYYVAGPKYAGLFRIRESVSGLLFPEDNGGRNREDEGRVMALLGTPGPPSIALPGASVDTASGITVIAGTQVGAPSAADAGSRGFDTIDPNSRVTITVFPTEADDRSEVGGFEQAETVDSNVMFAEKTTLLDVKLAEERLNVKQQEYSVVAHEVERLRVQTGGMDGLSAGQLGRSGVDVGQTTLGVAKHRLKALELDSLRLGLELRNAKENLGSLASLISKLKGTANESAVRPVSSERISHELAEAEYYRREAQVPVVTGTVSEYERSAWQTNVDAAAQRDRAAKQLSEAANELNNAE